MNDLRSNHVKSNDAKFCWIEHMIRKRLKCKKILYRPKGSIQLVLCMAVSTKNEGNLKNKRFETRKNISSILCKDK